MEEKYIQTTEWYRELMDDCRNIIVEYGFTARWAIIEGYHALGKRITEENANFERAQVYGKKIVHECAKSLGKSERTIYYAIQFYQKYPDLSMLPEGKNTSWGVIKTKYLPEPKQENVNEDGSEDIKEERVVITETYQSSMTRQTMIDVLTLGPIVSLSTNDQVKLLEYILMHGHKGFEACSDEELKQVMENTYAQDQIEFLSDYGIYFYEELLAEIKPLHKNK